MRKRLLAAVLTLAMCFGLGATALASETDEAPDVEGHDAVSVEFSGGSVIYLAEDILLSSVGEWSAVPASYRKITSDTQITVSNTGTDTSAFIYVELDPFYYKPEYQDVEGLRIYRNLEATINLSGSKADGNDSFGPASNDLYWNYDWSNTDLAQVYPNESVTFTLPETAPDEDMIYVLWCYIYYPKYDYYFWDWYYVSYYDLPGIPVAEAVPNASSVLVNGEKTAFDAYTIDGSNYFKLRDLAYVLSGSEKQFEVGWDGAANAISLTSGKPYTAVGGEMTASGNETSQVAVPTSSKIFVDGKEVSLTAYNINGNNYFKLRDLGQTFNFGVEWDGAAQTIRIDTTKGYTPD